MVRNKSYRKFIRWTDGQLVSSPEFTRKQDADEWYQEKLREKKRLKSGLRAIRKSSSFIDYCATWLNERKKSRPASTWISDEYRLRLHILPVKVNGTMLAQRAMEKISAAEWKIAFQQIKESNELSDSTMTRIRNLVHKIYADAMHEDPPKVELNPISLIKLPKDAVAASEPNFYSVQECLQYLKAANEFGPLAKLLAITYINSGFRKTEATALQWADIDFNLGRIRVSKIYEQSTGKIVHRTKAGKLVQRHVGINEPLKRALVAWSESTKFNRPTDFVFHNPNGKVLSPYQVSKIHRSIEKKAGVRHIRVHDLRHTFSSHFIMNGGNPKDLQFLLGHSSPIMTQRYVHLAPGYLESKASVVSIDVPDEDLPKVVEMPTRPKRGK